MRILFVSDWYTPDLGGVARQTENLGRTLKDKGHQVLVAAPSLSRQASRGEEYGLDTQRFPAFLSPYHADIFRISYVPYRRMRKLMQEWQPDIVHVQTPLTLGYSALKAAKSLGIPSTFTYHIFIYHSKGKWWRTGDLLYWKYWRHLFRQADVVTVPSQSTIDYLHQDYGPMPLTCVPNGIDLAQYGQRSMSKEQAKDKLKLTGKTVFFIAVRLSPEKRLEDAIRGFHQVPGEQVTFCIAGDGPLAKSMRQLVDQLGETRVKFLGQLDRQQVIDYYQATDACLFPSPIENHSIAMLETLAFGIPILGANAGGIGATLTDGVDGMLYPPRDPNAIADKIRAYLALSLADRQHMEQAARRTAEQFDFDTVSKKYLDLYQEVINRRQSNKSWSRTTATTNWLASRQVGKLHPWSSVPIATQTAHFPAV